MIAPALPCAVDQSGQKVQCDGGCGSVLIILFDGRAACSWPIVNEGSENEARKGLTRCCRRSCRPRCSRCPLCSRFHHLQSTPPSSLLVVVANYGLVLLEHGSGDWWLKLGEVVLPSPQASTQALSNHIESNQTTNKISMTKIRDEEKIIMTNVVFIYATYVLTLSWFVVQRIMFIRMFIKHRFGREKGFVHKDFITTFWSPKCFWCFEVMFIRMFIVALLWTLIWTKC